MRREAFVTVLLTSVVVLAGHVGFGENERAAARGRLPGHGHQRITVASDTFSGCVYGAQLVKVVIELTNKEGRCVPEVTPASVCVVPGAMVRFKVENGCPAVDSRRPLVEIGQAKFKRRLDGRTDDKERPPLFQGCSHEVPSSGEKARHVIHCEVNEDAAPGFYKYGLTGVVTLDPDVEVHPDNP